MQNSDAKAEASWPPLSLPADLSFEENAALSLSQEELEWTIVHELCHLLISPFHDMVRLVLGEGTAADQILQTGEEKAIEELVAVLYSLDKS